MIGIFIGSCTRDNGVVFEPYLSTLPEQETINASLYHYELLTKEAQKSFNNGDYLTVLQIYKTYLEIFYESEVSDENHLLYYVGMSLKRLCEDGRPSAAFKRFLSEDSEYLSLFGLKENPDQTLRYQHTHFREILENRIDYRLEWNVLQEYYLEDFSFAPTTPEEHHKNFAHFYYLITHFPNMVNYIHLAKNRTLIDLDFLNRDERKKFEYIQTLLEVYRDHTQINQAPPLNIIAFSKTGGLVLRSRSNLISSRNFARISAWEPFVLLRKVRGEDNALWWEVSHQKTLVIEETFTPKGYIPAENGFLTEIETLDGAPLDLALTGAMLKNAFETLLASGSKRSALKSYSAAITAFYRHEYFNAVEILSALIPQTDGKTKERALTLFYKTLGEIAKRSTSLDNDYTRFVIDHPLYFRIDHTPPKPLELKVAHKPLSMLIETNLESVMLQYYNDF